MWCLFWRILCTYCLIVESILRIATYPHQPCNPNKTQRECLQHMCKKSVFVWKRDLSSCDWRYSAISYFWQCCNQIDMLCVLERSRSNHRPCSCSKTCCAGTDWGCIDICYGWMIMHGPKRLPWIRLTADNQEVDHVRGFATWYLWIWSR